MAAQIKSELAKQTEDETREIEISKNMRSIEENYTKLSTLTNDLEVKVANALTSHEHNFFEAYKTYAA
jgi:hypothetical protein